jgi:hypothetical protein
MAIDREARGPPMTLGNAAAAQVRLIVRCKARQHQTESDPAEMAARYDAETPVLDWRKRLVCSRPAGRYGRDRDGPTIGHAYRAQPIGNSPLRAFQCSGPEKNLTRLSGGI